MNDPKTTELSKSVLLLQVNAMRRFTDALEREAEAIAAGTLCEEDAGRLYLQGIEVERTLHNIIGPMLRDCWHK